MSCLCLFLLLHFFSLEYECEENYTFSVVSTIGLLTVNTDFVKDAERQWVLNCMFHTAASVL